MSEADADGQPAHQAIAVAWKLVLPALHRFAIGRIGILNTLVLDSVFDCWVTPFG